MRCCAWVWHTVSDFLCDTAAEVPKRKICTVKLDESTAAVFRKAVKKHYWRAIAP